MAESDTAPNWGDPGPSHKARTLHPIGGAEGQRTGVEESELVIVLRAWESHVHGEARAQNTASHRTISLTHRGGDEMLPDLTRITRKASAIESDANHRSVAVSAADFQ